MNASENRQSTPEIERRAFVGDVELRAAPEGSKSPGTLVGYAAVFGKLSLDLGNFREQISPGAFREILKTEDVKGLFNHDDNFILGRVSAGTLRLIEDEVGLRFEMDLPDTTSGRDTAVSVGRRDIIGCSFSFNCDLDKWDWSGQVPIRTVENVSRLYDVGPVTSPAYEQTSVACRSFHAALKSRDTLLTPHISLQLAKARLRVAEAF